MKNALLLAAALLLLAPAARADDFFLKDGDRVVFYGDSITAQRLYTTFVETYVVTRFPKMACTFVHSGWGGDTVRGGGGGPIDTRLERDVIAYKPTVVTIMLGMNDGAYRLLDDKIEQAYEHGYEHLVSVLQEKLPGVRLVFIEPSPYDDVTRAPGFAGGYNATLVKFGAWLRGLAAKVKATTVDLNAPVVRCLEGAKKENEALAQKIVPDRVHPGPAGHLVMAEALLAAWHAPSLVSDVVIDAGKHEIVRHDGAKVDWVGATSWTQLDHALPFRIDEKDPILSLALRHSDVLPEINHEKLTVTGLDQPSYLLTIDGEKVATLKREDLEQGVDLDRLPTPMRAQAEHVHALTRKHTDVHEQRWHTGIQLDGEKSEHRARLLAEFDAIEQDVINEQRAAAAPRQHTFKLSSLY
jgi:lysophospholipase L1-like esterase